MKLSSQLRIVNRLRHLNIENKGLKLLSLVLAILLFAVSRQPISDVYLRGVPIEYRGMKPGIEIIADTSQSTTAGLRLRGPRDVVRNLISNQMVVVADLTNKELGERLIFLTADDSSLPDNTKVIGIEPASVKIRLEKTVRKVVGIEPQFAGDLSDDAEIYSYNLVPKNVEIEGPQSLVEKTTALYTESINLEGRRNGFNASIAVEPPNSSLRVITPGTINISFEIGERRAFRKIPNVTVLWPDQPIGSRILTKTVEIEIYGPESVIQSIRPEDLTAEIRASDLPDGADSAVPRVKLPSEIDRLVTVKNIYPKGVKVKRQ